LGAVDNYISEIIIGTVIQDSAQLEKIATQELLALLQQQPSEVPLTPKEVLVPVKKITRNNLPSDV